MIQTYSTNINGGKDRITSQYDFVGKVIKTLQQHYKNSSDNHTDILVENTYDHAGRLKSVEQSVNNETPIDIIRNTYDELGQLTTKTLHEDKQIIDYNYTIRGWLTGINHDKQLSKNRMFAMNLCYNKDLIDNQLAQYNGNIAATTWQFYDESQKHAYQYSYDEINRLKKANYGQYNGSFVDNSKYDVYGQNGFINYDLNGNIKSLYRNGKNGNLIDQLIYKTEGNQLINVNDAIQADYGFKELSNDIQVREYEYDLNGNMTQDLNKGLKVEYNLLNLPNKVSNTSNASDNVEFVYSASGEKLEKKVKSSLKNTGTCPIKCVAILRDW